MQYDDEQVKKLNFVFSLPNCLSMRRKSGLKVFDFRILSIILPIRRYLFFYLSLYLCISDDITNRRHNTAHVNFRQAVYRSLLLSRKTKEYNHIISYIKYCIKIFFLCVFILLIGALIKIIWQLYRH